MNKVQLENINYDLVLKDIVRSLADKKAENIVVLNLENIHSSLRYFVIATANSRVHGCSLTHEAAQILKSHGLPPKTVPIIESGWSILDSFDVVVHLFADHERNYYDLERLWADAQRIEF